MIHINLLSTCNIHELHQLGSTTHTHASKKSEGKSEIELTPQENNRNEEGDEEPHDLDLKTSGEQHKRGITNPSKGNSAKKVKI